MEQFGNTGTSLLAENENLVLKRMIFYDKSSNLKNLTIRIINKTFSKFSVGHMIEENSLPLYDVVNSMANKRKRPDDGEGKENQGICNHCKRPFPSPNGGSKRYDRYDHIASIDDKKSASRCQLCRKTTHFYCEKCEVNLCLVKKRNCFKEYHGY